MSADNRQSRWGERDERGAANLIDAAATLRGIASVRSGQVIPLSIPIVGGDRGPAADFRAPPQHYFFRDGGDYAAGLAERGGYGFSDDVLMLHTHGTTHIDALAHVWENGAMYNGFPATSVSSRGASRCGIDKLGPIVTRAIFLDLATEDPTRAVSARELEAALGACGIAPEPGDALLVRTGWLSGWRQGRADKSATAGLSADCADLIVRSGFALVAADNIAVEVMPSGDAADAVPLHRALTIAQGIYLAELFDLEALAKADRADVLLMLAPLAIKGGAGSPITPVAVL